ncbi:OOP family OmpA-OmpF porin [Arcticibacter tournemirensis]|uniref:OmpA family protein n=1 Tax=Arcticibacter tournemirensis TaxID=699437 RepID=A0A4Q0M7S4_9SPHI|nr:OmpA family protein [Arcticibacter tournemirensis]KAA8484640.1 OmpA family protein [Arcticibacter tournemirensis]RXF69104.1 OmpA family protein [Arcticibacter tournemirensis]TQM47070.1 OOP family OmpA-OmpF porin [Arcticibacter tournemirensis]
MNYSTIKKVVAGSLLMMAATAASAQDTTMTSTSTATVFGGRAQYRTWSIGVTGGVLTPIVGFGSNDYNDWDANLGYGLFIKKQLAPSFALKLDGTMGKLSGTRDDYQGGVGDFETDLNYAVSLKGVVNVGTVSFLSRTKNVGFFINAGAGLTGYDPGDAAGSRTELFIPVGAGISFKLGEVVALNLGYDANFLDADNLDGTWTGGTSNKDKWSYGYAGLEFTLGNSSKPSLQWSNPVALMYDELKDPTLRQEVEALKTRVSTLENTVNQLSADADGDGVSDRFDKCPGTPAGTVVDGAGCPLQLPTADSASASYSNIQFEFDSSVLRTSSYPTLDKVSSDLRANSSSTLTLEGHASAEGTEAYNMNLSRDRANSVKTYLVNSGVDANRVTVKAFGESRPLASNSTEEGRVQNRRVEIKK